MHAANHLGWDGGVRGGNCSLPFIIDAPAREANDSTILPNAEWEPPPFEHILKNHPHIHKLEHNTMLSELTNIDALPTKKS